MVEGPLGAVIDDDRDIYILLSLLWLEKYLLLCLRLSREAPTVNILPMVAANSLLVM